MKNLFKQNYWNPWIAVTEGGKGYEIENIKIYSDYGIILETGCGWFGSNNNLGDQEIEAISLKRSIDLKSKKNFIVKEEKKSYRIDHNYTLYIYYKDQFLNLEFTGFNLSSFWLESTFTIFDNYKIDDVLGYREKESDKIKYNKELEEAYKKFDSYNFDNHFEDIEQAIKTIKKYHKQYEEQKEKEKNYTLKDYDKMIYTNNDEVIPPMEIIKNIELTYNVKIEE